MREELPLGVKLFHTLKGHKYPIAGVAFDPQGGTLASGSHDDTVKLWDVRSGVLLRTFKGHELSVNSVAFDLRGQTLASGSDDDTVKLWDVRSGRLLRTLDMHEDSVKCVAFDPRGGLLASGSDDETVNLWDSRSGKWLRTLEGHRNEVRSVVFDPQVGTLISRSDDDTVKLWDAPSGKLLCSFELGHKWSNSLAFDPCCGTLASGGDGYTIKLWDARNAKLLHTFEGHAESVQNVAFSPDGRVLASQSLDDTVRLWNCETGETIAIITEPANTECWIRALAFHPTLPLLVTAGSKPGIQDDKRSRLIHLYDLDFDLLLGSPTEVAAGLPAIHHPMSKVAFAGDHSAGESAPGYRLIHGPIEKQESWLTLPNMAEPIQLPPEEQAQVETQRRAAEQRTRFEQAAFRVRAYVAEQKITPPETFISYAWGVAEHERWVEKRLAADLQKAGIQVVFDLKDNQLGDSLTRFISRIPYCSSVVVVGTPLYFQKFENRLSSTGSVVAAEVDLISQRLIGAQEDKRTVKPLLLAGEKKTSLPPLMWDGIYADFREESDYFRTAFDLILSLYQLPPDHAAVADLRESLRGPEMR